MRTRAGQALADNASADRASAGKTLKEGRELAGGRYRELRVWQTAHRFAMAVYQASESFPSKERFGLVSQLRRAALSVPTNIVEGHACRSRKEFVSFLGVAKRSLAESEYLIEVANELGYCENGARDELRRLRYETGKLLQALMVAL